MLTRRLSTGHSPKLHAIYSESVNISDIVHAVGVGGIGKHLITKIPMDSWYYIYNNYKLGESQTIHHFPYQPVTTIYDLFHYEVALTYE